MSAPAPASTPVPLVPVGAPGPWTVFTDYLGGDDILIQADPTTATRFLTENLGVDLADECGCEFGCGPIWSMTEGPNDDGSFPVRPVSVQEQQGPRVNGGLRTEVYLADQVRPGITNHP